MKKATITLTYDEEKLNAIRISLAEKDLDLDEELRRILDTFYKKHVHSAVRNYIESKDTAALSTTGKRPSGSEKEPVKD